MGRALDFPHPRGEGEGISEKMRKKTMARNTGQPWLVSRRYWLTGIGMAVGSGVLSLAVAACGSASTVSPTAASTPKPTVNAAAAAPTASSASSAAPAATAPAKAALSGTFTTLGWGDIPYNQAMLDDYAKAFPDKVGNLKFTAEGAKSE